MPNLSNMRQQVQQRSSTPRTPPANDQPDTQPVTSQPSTTQQPNTAQPTQSMTTSSSSTTTNSPADQPTGQETYTSPSSSDSSRSMSRSGSSNTPQPASNDAATSYNAAPSTATSATPAEHGPPGLVGNYIDSVKAAAGSWGHINDPSPSPSGGDPVPPRPDQLVSRTMRSVQSSLGAVTGLMGLAQNAVDVGFANLSAPIAALFPDMPAATLTSIFIGIPHLHAPNPVPLPSIGPILMGISPKVIIGGMPAARCGALGYAPTCLSPVAWFEVVTGSSNTFISGHRAVRITDIAHCCWTAPDNEPDPPIAAGPLMAAIGTAARAAGTAIGIAGKVAMYAGFAADAADIVSAEVEDDAAMATAKALNLAMMIIQMALDKATDVLAKAMLGKNPGAPPCLGMVTVPMQATVLIGGFPMVPIPNPAEMLLKRLSRYTAKSELAPSVAGCPTCPD